MSIADDALGKGYNALLETAGRTLQTVSATNAVYFTATLNIAPPFDPATELGSDLREKTIMELNAPGPAISINDYIVEPGTPNKWVVLMRDNNPADFTITYVLAKVTPQDV